VATFRECKQFQTVVNLERGKFGLVHRFCGTAHMCGIHLVCDALYPGI
jgi:hypothetical protein